MTLAAGPTQPANGTTKSRFSRLKLSMLQRLLPLGLRRAVFAASLVAHIKNISTPDKELAKRVSSLMDLTCDPSSLLFPMQMSHTIWKNLPTDSLDLSGNTRVTSQELHEFCTAVISCTPDWLLYNTKRAMREDIYRLVSAMAPCTAQRTGVCPL